MQNLLRRLIEIFKSNPELAKRIWASISTKGALLPKSASSFAKKVIEYAQSNPMNVAILTAMAVDIGDAVFDLVDSDVSVSNVKVATSALPQGNAALQSSSLSLQDESDLDMINTAARALGSYSRLKLIRAALMLPEDIYVKYELLARLRS